MSPAPGPSSSMGDVAFASVTSQATTSLDASNSSTVINNSSQETAAGQTGGPKTCLYCGRHIEANESTQVDEAAINAATPSPSSVAFVADTSSSTRISSILNANGSNPSDLMSLDEDGHQVCSACAARGMMTSNEVTESLEGDIVERSGLQERRRLRQSAQVAGDAEDTAMIVDGTPLQSEDLAGQMRSPSSLSTSRARDATPWRRAPWARISIENEANTIPMSLSFSNIETREDSQMTVNNDYDFPPLARSPQASQSTFQSPRHPASPTRARGITSPPTSPTIMNRHPSFSRTQSGTIIAPIPNSPIVNFPSRGRNRAGSGSSNSSLNLVGAIASSSNPPGRRPSMQRRLSRSNSSQGVKTPALMEASGINTESEKIEEELFGPSSMTRPRLSTMTIEQLASSSASKTVLTDAYDRKSVNKDIDKDDQEKNTDLIWFRYDRPDPRREISKLRCTSRGRGCLFPGAIFNGTQKSGRMSYDVTVQIVNVDMASSHLCGYLNIRGLTDDWPELTTYFDAEIIGQKYGFVTGKWGATENDDMKHWSRFSPFRPLKNSLTKPGLRFNHMNKPFIFMRWKERFLVPDHRVRDINGASFAGFYYVCVELGEEESVNLPITSTPLSPSLSSSTATAVAAPLAPPAISVGSSVSHAATPSPFTRQRSASGRRRVASANAAQTIPLEVSHWPRGGGEGGGGEEEEEVEEEQGEEQVTSNTMQPSIGPMAATDEAMPMSLTASTVNQAAISGRMSGFYFHEHSEPYQQLTLQHVAERSSSTFELR